MGWLGVGECDRVVKVLGMAMGWLSIAEGEWLSVGEGNRVVNCWRGRRGGSVWEREKGWLSVGEGEGVVKCWGGRRGG